MQDRPTTIELIAAVQHFLEQEVLPAVEDQRLRFRTRVAANALTIAQRELTAGTGVVQAECERLQTLLNMLNIPSDTPPAAATDTTALEQHARALRLELSRQIRTGAADSGPWRDAVIAATQASVAAKLAVSHPSFVERDARG